MKKDMGMDMEINIKMNVNMNIARKCRNAAPSGIRSVQYGRNKYIKTNDAGTSPVSE
jgi:hypothetical protein